MITVQIYLDNNTSEYGYKYIIRKNHSSFSACRNDNEFRYFLQITGLKFIPRSAVVCDHRKEGKGRFILAQLSDITITEQFFWGNEDIGSFSEEDKKKVVFAENIPTTAIPYIGLSNGSYVTCYSLIEKGKTTLYIPNPNSQSVFKVFDYTETVKKLASGTMLRNS